MLIFDQLKKHDPKLQAVSVAILSGLGLLLAGLWWVQVVSAREYRESLETQSFRTVRIPAVRGKILDDSGNVLAENRPAYCLSMYLEELRKPFDQAYFKARDRVRAELHARMQAREKQLGRKLKKQEKKEFAFSTELKLRLKQQARYEVASNVVAELSQRLQVPITLEATNFQRHYQNRLALPYPLLANVDPTNIARFEEQLTSPLGLDLEIQSTRCYPYETVGSHLLGSLSRNNNSAEGEESFFNYRLQDFRGVLGIEYGYDKELRGLAGAKSVQVNNIGYRTTENVWSPAEPGENVVLTIDLEVQQVTEAALQNAPLSTYSPVRGAAVVMDVRTGDVLALASSPTLNPNHAVRGYPPGEYQRIVELFAQKNRATQERYAPGSIFKTVVGLACLEAGFDPKALYYVAENPAEPGKGYIKVGNRPIRDTASPGNYDFRRALMRSSNSYFITNGLRVGAERIVRLGHKFHLGERIGLPLNQETAGSFPTLERLASGWSDGNTANMSIGQDPVLVTPMQIAVLTSALANGGKVLWPRFVTKVESQDPTSGAAPVLYGPRSVRDELGVSARSLSILQEAMVADTEDPEGTGHRAAVPGLRICGKTGTAQIQDEHNRKIGQTTWFISFAPYCPPGSAEKPRWAVVVMVENGKSGGDSCAPVAQKIYGALLNRERRANGHASPLANVNPR
ncbi:MAG TPA: penicillin-binding transpeptidase domain-containing protein [Verrucomicrobiae bacterium]